MSNSPRIMFTYWGRRGALSQFALEATRAAVADPVLHVSVSVSRQNEIFPRFEQLGASLLAIDTFQSDLGALTRLYRIPALRRQLYDWVCRDRPEAVVELMPHVWSPLIMPIVRIAGAKYFTLTHDAEAHHGDPTSWVKPLFDRASRSADLVFTLSDAVADRLVATAKVSRSKIRPLFHPDLNYGPGQGDRQAAKEPFRLLFLGRIMPYKGLPLFLEMVERLQGDGIAVEVGVFGEGALGACAPQLDRMGAEVVNRWLTESEIGNVLQRYHAVVLSHTEASQSGVAAAAYGAGLPIIATPVGGLVEQVRDGVTGTVAERVDAGALAVAAKRLLLNPQTYLNACLNIRRLAHKRSMDSFIRAVVSTIGAPEPGGGGSALPA